MQQVDFYILPDTTSEARWLFACKLIEKVYRLGFQIHVNLDNLVECTQLSELLWAFKPESFLPHIILSKDSQRPEQCPITLSTSTEEPAFKALNCEATTQLVFINLSSQRGASELSSLIPTATRIAEIVVQEPECLASTRERYKLYQQQGITIETRKIDAA